jgi:hypothetical protein
MGHEERFRGFRAGMKIVGRVCISKKTGVADGRKWWKIRGI